MTVTIPSGATIGLSDLRCDGGCLLDKPERIIDPITGNDVGAKLRVHVKRPGDDSFSKKAMFVFRNDTERVYIYEIWEAWFTDEDREFLRRESERMKTHGWANCLGRVGSSGPGIDRPYERREFPIDAGDLRFTARLNGVIAEYDISRWEETEFSSPAGGTVMRHRHIMDARYDLATEKVNIDYHE